MARKSPHPVRALPLLTPLTEPFWTSGADGRLRFQRCGACGYYSHPPAPRCTSCLSADIAYAPVSGLGTVYAVTANHYEWAAGWEIPYTVAIVQMDEQEDLRLLSNVVGHAPRTVHIGDRVHVTFEQQEDVWLPLFALETEGRSEHG